MILLIGVFRIGFESNFRSASWAFDEKSEYLITYTEEIMFRFLGFRREILVHIYVIIKSVHQCLDNLHLWQFLFLHWISSSDKHTHHTYYISWWMVPWVLQYVTIFLYQYRLLNINERSTKSFVVTWYFWHIVIWRIVSLLFIFYETSLRILV